MTGHPFLTAIGDWVMVALKDDGTPVGIGDKPARVEVCEVTGIVEEKRNLMVHLVGEGDEKFKVGYYNIRHISISDETLQAFGFESCEGDKYADDWLFDTHRWRLDCRNVGNPELGYFYISWNTDNLELGRSYRIICRDYGEDMILLEDTIAELQHFFFRYNSEWTMPLKYKGRSHFTPPKRHEPSAGPIFEAIGIDKRLIGMEDDA